MGHVLLEGKSFGLAALVLNELPYRYLAIGV